MVIILIFIIIWMALESTHTWFVVAGSELMMKNLRSWKFIVNDLIKRTGLQTHAGESSWFSQTPTGCTQTWHISFLPTIKLISSSLNSLLFRRKYVKNHHNFSIRRCTTQNTLHRPPRPLIELN